MTIERNWDESTGTYMYSFIKDNLKLRIFFGGNLDLSWQIIDLSVNDDNLFEYENKPLEFTIDKENMEVYSLFLKLYDDVLNREFTPEEEKSRQEELEELDLFGSRYSQEFVEQMNRDLEKTYNLLVDEGIISWHSDETYYEAANVVNIEMIGEDIKLTFIEQMKSDYSFPGEISIRFRNSGSTYDPFNRIFMNHFNALASIDPEYHQIHMEEYVRKLK